VTGLARVSRLVLAILISGQLIGCGPTATAAGVVGSGYEVRADKNKVWASIKVLNPLDALTLNAWKSLVNNGMVTTDPTGIAELKNTGRACSGLYVFRKSGVQLGSCSPGAAGNWICVVGAASSTNCNVGLTSPSVKVTLRGTWVSLITLDNGALSIVTVLKGAVEVVPVTKLEYRYAERDDHSFVLEFTTRELDENQTIQLVEGQSTYTASDDYLAMLRQSVPLPDARVPLGPEQFQLFIRQLLPRYPLLQEYLEDVRMRATFDGQIFPTDSQIIPAVPESTILLQGQGGFLADTFLQQVVLLGVEWNAVQKVMAGGQPISLAFQLPGRDGLLTDQTYDPNTARKISEERKLGQNAIMLLLPPGDDILRRMADSMIEAFKSMGIPLNLEEVPPGDMPPKIEVSVAAGIPVLWLERR
jgi:hypothetical protein